MVINFRRLAIISVIFAMFSVQASYYPMWLTPQRSEDSGIAVMAKAELGNAQWKSALSRLRYNIETYPTSQYRWWYMLQLAYGLYELNELESAISWYNVLEKLPDNATLAPMPNLSTVEAFHTESRLGLARCYVQQGETQKAIKYLNMILPRNDADRVLLAELNFQIGRTNTAQRLLGETAGVKMSDGALQMRASQIYRATMQYQKANELLTSVQKINSNKSSDIALKSQAKQLSKFSRMNFSNDWVSGTFEGVAATSNGELKLKVTTQGNKIKSIEFIQQPKMDCWSAYDSMSRRVKRDKYVVVDPVQGAEECCLAIQTALFSALEAARRN